ncbi:methyltransferase [Loigolactobacillus backii]|uniref:Methyltransferase n=1 Tax=Loigolactobacillus backii TaxID=375175 RepID=A0A192H404_9LACO|nr:MgtC/SapB family protein [Loigolactobacillus backii]ANK63554.1 methyltransferase [Loigolactobacillus backii]ANK70954.1 methyltransferase [Loigolactobacillus backii]
MNNSGFIIAQLELVLRLILAALCGFAIGYERKNRLKEAGIRTHMIVALGAALIMIVSKDGFFDVLNVKNVVLDPSRIAAQIVSGISFLGAGTILVRRQGINGLTTAAGIWTTAAVGMAIGARLYVVGISATLLVLLIQILLHKQLRFLPNAVAEQLSLEMLDQPEAINNLEKMLQQHNIELLNLHIERQRHHLVEIRLAVKLPPHYKVASLMSLLGENEAIQSVDY